MQHSNIDPEFHQAIEQLKAVLGETACFDFTNLDAARSITNAMAEASISACPPRPNVNITQSSIYDDEFDINVKLQIYTNNNDNENQPIILFIHGGGYVMGGAHHAHGNLTKWCDELSATIISVDYRLAPEHPFPAALYDCYAALKWVSKNPLDLNIDNQRIVIVGDSAGGGLASSLTLYSRDHSDIDIAFQLLMWPMLDPSNVKDADPAEPIKILWNQASNKFAWNAYLEKDIDSTIRQYASPIYIDDLNNLPATFIAVGDQDLFFDEGKSFAIRLQENAVSVDFKSYSGGFHGFSVVNPTAKISQQFNQDVFNALAASLLK